MKERVKSLARGLGLVGLSSLYLYGFTVFDATTLKLIEQNNKNSYLFFNGSDYVAKIKASEGILCSNYLVGAGQKSECTIKEDQTAQLSLDIYKLKQKKVLGLPNSSFEEATLESWSSKGEIEVENSSYKYQKGEFTVRLIGSDVEAELSYIVEIPRKSFYLIKVLAASDEVINQQSIILASYLDKNKQLITESIAQKVVSNSLDNGLQEYILILPPNKKAAYIQFKALSRDASLVIDELQIIDSKKYRKLISIKKKVNTLSSLADPMSALCNTCDGQVGDHVWIDSNKNGKYDSGEKGLAGVRVEAIKDGKVVQTVTTNKSGYYKFYKLCKGEYKFRFIAPSGYKFTKHIKGFVPEHNSAHSNGYTDEIYVYGTYRFNNLDAGLYKSSCSLKAKIDLEKSTNGVDADTGTGPVVSVGSRVTWKYVVKNRGNVVLKDIIVRDDKEGIICSGFSLNPGYSKVCTKSASAIVGQYENKAIVRAKAKASGVGDVEDMDISHYYGKITPPEIVCPIGYNKYDAGEQKHHLYYGGTTVVDISSVFGNMIKNPSKITIKNAVTWDGYKNRRYTKGQSKEMAHLVFVEPNNHKKATLYTNDLKDGVDYAESKKDLGTITLPQGAKKVVLAHVSDINYGSKERSSPNSLYFRGFCYKIESLVQSSIDIEKYTNGVDADSGTGPIVAVGSKVTWKYIIKNRGNVVLQDIIVKDDKEGIVCSGFSLNPGETKSCTKTGIAKAGQYANLATVTAKDTIGKTVSDKDPSHYYGKVPNNASLGDYVWYDANMNGIQDTNEKGIKNVKVQLLDSNSKVLKEVTTDSNGYYLFTGLAAGTYKIRVIKPKNYPYFTLRGQGGEAKDSDIDPNSGISDSVQLKNGENYRDLDAGLVCQACSKIDVEKYTNGQDADTGTGPVVAVGSTVTWKYVIKNIGNTKLTQIVLKDSKEGIISCPKSSLNAGESMICTKTAKAKAGQYVNLATVISKNPIGKTVIDSDPSHYYGKVGACVGNFVWHDKNANGIQDASEAGVAGAKVEITDINGNSVRDIYGNSVASITTSSNGEYKFCKLNPGKYIITVTPPSGYIIAPANVGGDDSKDSDINPSTAQTSVITLKEGDNDLTWDVGLYKNACIGNYIWEDIDGNGIQDSGEAGIEGVVVTLYNAQGAKIATQTTKSDGLYKFCGLKPGRYKVKMDKQDSLYYVTYQNKGDDESKDSDIDPVTRTTNLVTLQSGEYNMNIDGGYYRCGSLVGVYSVINPNMMMAYGLTNPLEGRLVKVYNVKGELVATAKTDKFGRVEFEHLPLGDYRLEYEKVDGLEFTFKAKNLSQK